VTTLKRGRIGEESEADGSRVEPNKVRRATRTTRPDD
jgi:hypothetical protein